MTMIALSLIANVVITFAVTFAIWQNRPDIDAAFGPDTPARRIVGCVYLAIGLISLYAITQLAMVQAEITRAVAITLLPLQIIYKLLTAIAIGPRHPVVVANLGVVVLHSTTLLTLP